MTSRLTLRAFAKVNYALEVLGLREDGYHNIRTVLQSISLADEVEIEQTEKGFELLVEPEGIEVGSPQKNTAHRAWNLLREFTGEELPVRVRLHKKIPAGAGLGGASADAAAVLTGLNDLFGLGLAREDLQKIGGRIGADVPFCLSGGTALGEGVGEVLSPLPAPPPHRIVLVKPEQGANTAEIYRTYDEFAPESLYSASPAISALKAKDLGALARTVGNDLTPVTRRRVPEIEACEDELLRTGALGVAMSGTGSAVYGIFGTEDEARFASERIRAHFVGVYEPVVRGLERMGELSGFAWCI